MRTAAAACLAIFLLGTGAGAATTSSSHDPLEAAITSSLADLDAPAACVSLDILPAAAVSATGADPLHKLETTEPNAIAAASGAPWSTARTRSSLKAIPKSHHMRLAHPGCAQTLRVEAPRDAGDQVAVRVAVLHKGAATLERAYLLRRSGAGYRVVARTDEQIIVS